MRRICAITVVGLLASPVFLTASGLAPAKNPVQVRVLTPRMGAEIPFGQDKITIVVEIEDRTEEGIELKKGIPVFEPPRYVDGKVNDVVKANVDLFLKSIVAATSYKSPPTPNRRSGIVYQLTAVVKVALLGGGCRIAVAPESIPPGASEALAAGYKAGAEFEFRVGNSSTRSEPDSAFSPNLCVVVAEAPVP